MCVGMSFVHVRLCVCRVLRVCVRESVCMSCVSMCVSVCVRGRMCVVSCKYFFLFVL